MNLDKTIQNAIHLGIILLALFIGFFSGYLVFSKKNLGYNHVASHNEVAKLSLDGLKIAEGLVSPCGSNEPLSVHNCSIANSIKTAINHQLNSGKSIKAVRETLIQLYGEKILAK